MLQETIIYLAQGFVLNTKQFLNTNTRAAVNKILSYMHFSNKFVSNIQISMTNAILRAFGQFFIMFLFCFFFPPQVGGMLERNALHLVLKMGNFVKEQYHLLKRTRMENHLLLYHSWSLKKRKYQYLNSVELKLVEVPGKA